MLLLLKRRYDAISNRRNTRNTPLKLELLSKLAVLELGGWIETAIDQILVEYVSRKISDTGEQARIRHQIIDRVYGFDLDRNIWPLFERILGVAICQRLKSEIENTPGYLQFTSDIGDLAKARKAKAHTCWSGITPHVETPSWVLDRFQHIYPIVQHIRSFVAQL